MVLLKRLSQARADGDRVLCVVRGTAVNQDGRSNGLTAPNGPAQQAVIGQALAASRLKPSDIDYLEAHGTGTELGDPTEMGAIGHVFGHRDTPLMIGSAKANIGHLEGAAGVAGLIKTCLALAHQGVPPHPLLEPDSDGPNGPSPHIDWSLPIEIPTQLTPWPRREGHVRRAGVSSFGFGGTNAHAILEEAPLEEAPEVEPEALNEEPVGDSLGGLSSAALDAPRWVTLSARTPTALAALAERYASDLPDAPLEAIAYAANTGRAAHAERLAIRATSRAEFINRLTNWQDEPSPHVARGAAPRARSTGWLFGGQGGCRPGMGRELYARYPVFRQTWDAADQVIRQHWPRNLATICWEEPDKHLAGVDAQVALVAWQIALAQLWRSWAGAPAWVVGHSLGELAAAVTAGMLERDDALRLVCRRAELLDSITEDQRGRMLAVMATVDQVTPLLGDELSIAAENGPRQTVVSGSEAALAELAEKLTDKRLRTRPLATSHAFHSHLIEPILDEFKVACARIPSQPPTLGFLSTLTGQPIETALPPDYWADQLRGTVRFSQAINGAADDSQLLELSPTPVLRSLTQRDVASAAGWKQDEAAQVAEASAAQLWTAGVAIDFKALHPPQRLSVSLPTYPFERQRHWFAAQTTNRPVIAGEAVHPLLGRKLDVAGEAVVFETDLAGHAWLADHKLRDRPTLPAVAYLELAWAAARCVNGGQALGEGQAFEVRDLELERPLVFGPGAGGQEDNGARVQTLLTPDGEGFRVEVLQRQPQGWRRMAHARLNPATTQPVAQPAAAPHVDRQVESRTQPPTITNPLTSDLTDRDIARHYADCRDAGLDYGPAFQAITKLSGGESCATATLNLPQAAPSDGYLLPPPMADAALQAIAAAIPKIWNAAFVPKSVKIASLHHAIERRQQLHAEVSIGNSEELGNDPPQELLVDVTIANQQHQVIAELADVRLARIAGTSLKRFFRPTWTPRIRKTETSPPPSIAADTLGKRLASQAPTIANVTGATNHLALLRDLESTSGQLVANAFAELDAGNQWQVGKAATVDELARSLNNSPDKRRLFHRMLDITSEQGWVERQGESWRMLTEFQQQSLTDRMDALRVAHPTGSPEINLLERCGPHLASVLRGETDPLPLLFPTEGGGAADLYRHSAGSRALNMLTAEAVATIASQLSPGRGLRILEIGAGTGATTEQVLQRIDLDRAQYVFTDVAPGFLAAARGRLPQHPNLKFQTLDIERNPVEQDFEPHQFDVVIAANVLHATADLTKTIQHTRQLLAPGGQLLLVEGNQPIRWLDLTFGMTEGWWRYEDTTLRPAYPLIDAGAWQALLTGNGFDQMAAVSPVAPCEGLSAENQLLVATADETQGQSPLRPSGHDGKRATVIAWNGDDAQPLVAELNKRTLETDSVGIPADASHQEVAAAFQIDSLSDHYLLLAPPTGQSASQAEQLCNSLLALLQSVASAVRQADSTPSGASPCFSLLTRGAQRLASDPPDSEPNAALGALWGLVKAAARELPEITFRCIDLPANAPLDSTAAIDELLHDAPAELEVAIRPEGRFVMRLDDASPTYQAGQARQLQIAKRGSIDGLRLAPSPRVAPATNEVQIRVAGSGVNFRDLLNLLGRYPGTPPLGAELSGVVTEVGEGVTGFAPGDRVIAITGDAFADYVTVGEQSVVKIPDGLSLNDAATAPVAYATAAVALEELATLSPGMRVLIHAATGGVGMAAVQIANSHGAEVFATASVGKQQALRNDGVPHVYDSRSDEFAQQVLRDSQGAGVEVLVNMLGEEMLPANLKALAEGGLFVDLTKPTSDVASQIAKLRPDVRYHLVDLADDWDRRPERIRSRLAPLLKRIAAGQLKPLPSKSFELTSAADAFRLMQRAGHVGKLLLTPSDRMAHAPYAPLRFDKRDACVITGGFGDLGLMTAELFANAGAGVLGLVGRRPPNSAANDAIESLRQQGVQVLPLVADVADRPQLDAALNSIRSTGAAIKAVVHSAGTLDDGLLEEQTDQKMATVFAAKAHGCENLHLLTQDDPLEQFAVYSSVASIFGAPGQSNHSAANAYLDGLIANRRATGQCGVAINWGPWRAIGEAARRGVDARTDLGGLDLLSPTEGRAAMAQLLLSGCNSCCNSTGADSQLMVAPWDLRRLPDWLQSSPLLEKLVSSKRAAKEGNDSAFLKSYQAAPTFRRRSLLVDHLRDQLATVLGMGDSTNISPTTAMFDLGLDSLTTLELKNALHYSLGIDLPTNLVFDFPTIDRFADEIDRRLAPSQAKQPPSDAASFAASRDNSPPASSVPPEVENDCPATANQSNRTEMDPENDSPTAGGPIEADASVWDDLAALEEELESWEGAS